MGFEFGQCLESGKISIVLFNDEKDAILVVISVVDQVEMIVFHAK